jgi:hypothetical protein
MRKLLDRSWPAFLVAMLPLSAHAEPPRAEGAGDPAAARALFAEGRQLAAQQKYDQACPKFEESLRLNSGVGTMFNLADCLEHVGKTATAWARFLDASAGARAAGQADRERIARDRAAALEPKLSRLTIDVRSADTGLEVRRDGQLIGRAAWGTAVPVDPGPHRVEASAAGKRPWSTNVEIGPKASIAVTVPPLENGPEKAQPETAIHPPTPTSPTPSLGLSAQPTAESGEPIANGSWSTPKTIGIAVAGVGVAGLVVGTVFALSAKSKNDSALAICVDNPGMCPVDDVARHDSLVDSARSARTGAYVGFGVGGAALVAGAVVFLTAPAKTNASTGIAPLMSRDVLGLGYSTAW